MDPSIWCKVQQKNTWGSPTVKSHKKYEGLIVHHVINEGWGWLRREKIVQYYTILLDVCICMKSNLLGEKLSKEPPFLLTNETLFDWRLMCYKQSPSPSFLQNRIWLRCHWVDHLWQDCYLQPQIPVSLANLKFLSLYPSFSSIIGWEGSPRKNVVLPLFFNKYTMKNASTDTIVLYSQRLLLWSIVLFLLFSSLPLLLLLNHTNIPHDLGLDWLIQR